MFTPKKYRKIVKEIYVQLCDEEARDPYFGGKRINWLNFYKKFNKIIEKNPELAKIPLSIIGASRKTYKEYVFDILVDKFLLHYVSVKKLFTIFSKPAPKCEIDVNYKYIFVIFDKLSQDILFPVIDRMMLIKEKLLIITLRKIYQKIDEEYRKNIGFFILDEEVLKLPKMTLKEIFTRSEKQRDEIIENIEDEVLKEALRIHSAFLGLQIKLANLQYYLFCEIFSKITPKAVVSLNPTVAFASAKKCGINTVMFQHGLVGDKITVVWPYVSDYIIIWGEIWRDNFIKNTEGTVEIKSLGNPRFDDLVKASKKIYVEKKKQKKRNIVYISAGGVYNEYTKSFFAVIEKIVKKFDNKIDLIIKLHPREDVNSKKIFKKHIDKEIFNKLIFIKEEPIEDVLHKSEIILLFSSTVILEAMVLQKPVLRINFTGYPVLEYDDFTKFGLDDAISDTQELLDNIEKCLNDENHRKMIIKKQNEFLNKYISNLGTSTDTVINFITKDLTTRKHKGALPIF